MTGPPRPVLVADDEDEIRAMLREHLTSRGYEVLEASDGLETLWSITHKRPGVVLLDLAMPRLGGLEILPRIRAFDASIRVIVVTGHVTDENLARVAVFAVPVLPKPLDLAELDQLLAAGGAAPPRQSAILRTGTSHAAAPASETAERSGPGTAIRARVLLVDGSPTSQTIGALLLKKLGCRVDVAADGQEAIAQLLMAPYDVMFMDCAARQVDAYRSVAEIRRRQRETVWRVPIIAMTAQAGGGDRSRAIAAGMDDCIGVPLRRGDVEAVLARWCGSTGPDDGAARAIGDTTDGPALDPTAVAGLTELTSGDAAVLEQLFATFLSDAGRCLASMRQAHTAADAAGLRRAAHTLKGGSSAIGAAVLARLSQELHASPATAAAGGAEEQIAGIEREVERVRAAIQQRAAVSPGD
jgi:CheY-like chemotaxis protein/HPt (histidine-containing phosphotransfer) domain-containing protein